MALYTAKVASVGDDMHLDWSGFSYSNTANPMDIGDRFGTVRWSVVAWFDGVTVPNAATINSAALRVTSAGNYSNTSVHVVCSLEDADDPAVATSHGDATGRTLTTANTDIASVPAFTTGNTYDFDITSAVQEVVDRAGWASGQAMQVFIVSQSDTSSSALRQITSRDGSSTDCPEIRIDYTAGGGPTFTPKIINYM